MNICIFVKRKDETNNRTYSFSKNSRQKRGLCFSIEYEIKEFKNRCSLRLIRLQTIYQLQMNRQTTFMLFWKLFCVE